MDGSPPDSLSRGFSRQEYWSGLPCPPPGDLPNPGTDLASLMSPALPGGFFTSNTTWEAHVTPEQVKFFLKLSFLSYYMQILTPTWRNYYKDCSKGRQASVIGGHSNKVIDGVTKTVDLCFFWLWRGAVQGQSVMNSISDESPHPGVEISFSSSFYKYNNPVLRTPPSWPRLTLITSQMLHLQIQSH